MIPEYGHFALILALCLAVLQSIVPLYGAIKGDAYTMALSRSLTVGQFTFENVEFVWEGLKTPHQVVHRQDDGAFHHAVNHQPMLLRINFGQARVIALEHDTRRRNNPLEICQWCKTDRCNAVGCQPVDGAALHVGFVL